MDGCRPARWQSSIVETELMQVRVNQIQRRLNPRFKPLNFGLVLSIGLAGLGAVNTSQRAIAQSSAPTPEWYNCLTLEVWTPEKQAWCDKLATMQQAEYPIPNFGSVTLTNGVYESTDPRFRVVLANQEGLIQFADVNGDGNEDAVGFLNVNSGGSGQFVYLATVLNINETPQSLVPVFLGDRVQIQSLAVQDSQLVVDLITQGPNEPLCCPTQPASRTYAVLPALVQVGGEPPLDAPEPVRASADTSDSENSTPAMTHSIVQGTVTYRQRIALPPTAVVEVALLDVSRADTAAETLAKQTIALDGRQVPVAFALPYDDRLIDPRHTYAVQARILVDGELWFTNTSRYAVISQGHPTELEVVVESVR
jgi:uncharacterized lipoprotein YbaY